MECVINQSEDSAEPDQTASSVVWVHFHIFLTFLTHCIPVDSSTVICWTGLFVIVEVLSIFCCFYSIFDRKSC